MPKINNINNFVVPAEDGNLYDLIYTEVIGGKSGCTANINGVTVKVSTQSNIYLLVNNISGGTGCFLGGYQPENLLRSFVSVWDTTKTSTGSSTATQIKLPLISTGSYNFIVNWGDGSTNKITTWNQAETTHTYANAGTYQLTITGTFQGFRFANTGDRLKLLSIFKWGTGFRLGATDQHFYGCANLDLSIVEDVLNLDGNTTLNSSFRACTRLTTVNRMNEWDVSKNTTFDATFYDSYNFNTYIGDWDTSNVTNMFAMFFTTTGTKGLFNQNRGNWDTSKVTTMAQMFENQYYFNQDIGTKLVTKTNGSSYIAWDTLNVTNISRMFSLASLSGVFNNGGSSSIGNWNTSKMTTIRTAFQAQPNFNQDVSTKVVTVGSKTYIAWDTSNVNDMAFTFIAGVGNTGKFNQNIGNWNTSKVTAMQSMINNQPYFNQDISTKIVTVSGSSYIAWNTSNVTNMSSMFGLGNINGVASSFNGNITNWDTSKVTNMFGIFANQKNFNQDVGTKVVTVSGSSYIAWNTSNVTNMSLMFTNNVIDGKFNNGDSSSIGNWNTSKVTTMNQLFTGQPYFNQDVGTKVVTISGLTYSAWSVSAVTLMDFMFYTYDPITTGRLAGSFNNSGSTLINNWDTRKVTSMQDMFDYQKGFNQSINNWNISGVTLFNQTGNTRTAGFMFGKTFNDYSTTNYDALLIGWASRSVKPNILIDFGTIKYTNAATAARTVLTSAPNNWTIVDGGLA